MLIMRGLRGETGDLTEKNEPSGTPAMPPVGERLPVL